MILSGFFKINDLLVCLMIKEYYFKGVNFMDNLAVLQDIFREIFDDDNLVINRETNSADIDEWDSLIHINIITACEDAYKVEFSIEEIISFKNVGDMLDLLDKN